MTFSSIIVVIKSCILFPLCFSVTNKRKPVNWKHIDSYVRQQLNAWNEPAPVFERSLLPHELCELFSTNAEMERIYFESTNYVDHVYMFTMTEQKLKAFLTILLISGYVGLSRQEMYRKRREDCHNVVVSPMMTEFLEYKQYLHLAHNNALNSSDKFAKVRPLFNAINKQCIFNYQPTQHVSIENLWFLTMENMEQSSVYIANP